MLSTFSSLSPHLKFKKKFYSIDNLAFKFHYRATFLLLLVCTVLVTSRQYIGEHIRCMTGGAPTIPEHVINTFCFFTTTFTVIRHYNETLLRSQSIPHPGIGPMYEEDPIKHHAYYQWVPFVLFSQAIMFYLPHLFWRSSEGGKIKLLVEGLNRIKLSKYITRNENLNFRGGNVMSKSAIDGRVSVIKVAFLKHIEVNRLWAWRMVLCEVLNLLNVLLQIYCTHRFLGRQFLRLGINVMNDDFTGQMDALDIIFPKVTKCHFYKFGASGSVQKHDALCVMALNVINEKIFTFLWFWYILLVFVSVLALIWRLITLCCHSRSSKFNGFVFSFACPGRLNPYEMEIVINHLLFSDWLFLYYLAKNIHSFMFRDLLKQLANEIGQQMQEENDENEMRKMGSDESVNESYGYDEQNENEKNVPSLEEQQFLDETPDVNRHKKPFMSSDF